jgi:hypothetical protein
MSMNMLECRADAISNEEKVKVFRVDRPFGGEMVKPFDKGAPVLGPDEHYGKMFDLPGLNQRQRLEQFVKCAEPSGKPDEGVGVLEQENLTDKEVAAGG